MWFLPFPKQLALLWEEWLPSPKKSLRQLSSWILFPKSFSGRLISSQDQDRLFKKCAAYVLRSVAKHSKELAQNVVDNEGLLCLKDALEEYDPSVKEAACWAISHIARFVK